MPRGRPKSDNPRDLVIRFRVSQAEYEQLQRAGMQHRPILSPGEYARLVALAQSAARERPRRARAEATTSSR